MSAHDAPGHFDRIAAQYDSSLPEHVQAHYRRKRVRVLAPLAQGADALDVGCGTGLLMADLAAAAPGARLTGIDDSRGMIEVLRREGRGTAVVGPADALPFADASFDVVFCVAVLHHVADAEQVARVIREMARVTRPRGSVVIWDHNPRNPYWPALMRKVPQDSGVERLIPLGEILAALRQAGVRQTRAWQSGFVPEFMPRWLMPVARAAEAVLEHLPFVRRYAAHNVVVAVKGGEHRR